MTHEVSPVYLLDVATKKMVKAELWDSIDEQHVEDWETEWVPELFKAIQRMKRAGVEIAEWPESRNWNWRAKTTHFRGMLDRQGFAVMCEGVTQGMMFVDLGKHARHPDHKGQHLVYVDFLEAAPWNRSGLVADNARYRGVGSILISAAVMLSKEVECHGRIGLHSLPQANRFYANSCGMQDFGPDASYQNLRYFEMTPGDATAFLEKGEER